MKIIIVNYGLLFLLHVLFVEAQEVQFQFEVLVERYQNQGHRNAAGDCCSGSRRSNCNNLSCNNLFMFCAGPSGHTSVDMGTCPYGLFSFTIHDDDIPFTTTSSIVSGSQVPNPIVFQRNESWTGRFQLEIVVNNVILFDDTQLVDIFNHERSLNPSTDLTPRETISGNLGQGEIELRYRVQCTPNYYGSDCSIRCVPTDRFTCDSNGNIMCREGYQNEAKNCSDCASITDCDVQEQSTVSTINSPEGAGNEILGTESNSNQTTALNPSLGSEQQGGLSQGGVAGVVITVLIVVALLVGGAVAIGIVLCVYQPWSNGWFGVEDKLKKMNGRNDAISNPVYEQNEIDSSAQYTGSPVRGVKYTPTTGGVAGNGQVNINMLTQSLDDDNPLYASSALEKILSPRDADGTRNANGILQEELTRGSRNGHAQSNKGAIAASPQHNIAKIATLRESASLEHILMSADVRDLTKQSKPQSSGPPPVPMKPKIQLPTHHNSTGSLPRAHRTTQEATTSFLIASQSLNNLLKPNNNVLNPYGDYGDKTLQRVASANSVNEAGAVGNRKTAKNDQMFDNPDYECVNPDDDVESDQPKDIDYEEIES